MIVVDTNVVAGLFFAGPNAEHVERLFAEQPEWYAPPLWRSELRNVVLGYVRAGHIGLYDGIELMREAETLMEDADVRVGSEAVLRLAAASGCTAYDCEFIAVAEALGAMLYTFDKALLKAFPAVARSPAAPKS